MRRLLTICAILASVCAVAATPQKGKTTLRVGTYDITNSFNRQTQVKSGKMSPVRLWCHSVSAVADAILEANCDIMGIQDVCDTIAGRLDGVKPLITVLREKGGDYEWLVLSNKNPSYPLEGKMSNGTGILWRSSRFELRDYGIYWLSGTFDKPGRAKEFKYGGKHASMMWVRLFDKDAQKELVFTSAGVNGPSQNSKTGKVTYHEINVANCRNILEYMNADIAPKGTPSIITLNARNAPSYPGYKALTSSRWFDVYDRLKEEGSLGEADGKTIDTMNSLDEKKLQGGRPDHILEDGFSVKSYSVLRKKYRTADGTQHYPALHFPVIAELQY